MRTISIEVKGALTIQFRKYTRKLLLASMVETGGLVNNTRNHETCLEANLRTGDVNYFL